MTPVKQDEMRSFRQLEADTAYRPGGLVHRYREQALDEMLPYGGNSRHAIAFALLAISAQLEEVQRAITGDTYNPLEP